ncbi:TPA: hypothetical protein EYN65_20365 [Candidatus Poribacteria bacterium]|jgi:hypothetical protein|nr:hypothetical protein [Candidatus Poribacteria bacterium]HIB98112.1 hypothetical protein [Candidatus Poribacteria bacterium]HIN27900.1 hypothetical protein [Candidatus Poribacteria bacterium]HIO08604.1 hypothetical protein [Candidatus Poribacteria bacterium]HIO79312.1 hypothetical protein [Candidatus Poribacteria bacterium]
MDNYIYPVDYEIMQDFAKKHPIFRLDAPSLEDISFFHQKGYIAYPGIFTDEGQKGFMEEILAWQPMREHFSKTELQRSKREKTDDFNWRNWDDKGPWSDQLIDAPFVTAALKEIIGNDFHFCHSTLHIAFRGAAAIPFHQDHHHWKHDHPINLAERDKYYIQMLYYPTGFKQGDRSISVISGSSRVAPTKEVTPDKLIAGEYDDEAGCQLKVVDFDLPPGSMVLINARTFHAVAPKPLDSPQEYRMFVNYIFKEAGPPHRFTQPIPPQWIRCASPARKKLLQRDHWTEDCWLSEKSGHNFANSLA